MQQVIPGRKGWNKITVSHPFFPPYQFISTLHAKFKSHTRSSCSDQEFKVGACLKQKITGIYFVKIQDFINLWNGIMIFGSIRIPKSKNKGNLSFLVIYGPSDPQRGATWSVPSTETKRSSEECHLLAFKEFSWWRLTHEIGKVNKTGTTPNFLKCVQYFTQQSNSFLTKSC